MAKAKVKVSFDRPGVTARIKTQVGRELVKNKVAQIVKKELVKELRAGRLPDGRINPDLEPSTIDNRRRISEVNPTHPDFSADFSNLTLTGELLDKGLRSRFVISKFQIVIDPANGFHKIYQTRTRRTTGVRKRSRYSEIFDALGGLKNRDVFNFGPRFLSKVSNTISKILAKSLG